MTVINLFIAFFIIVALAISWLVFDLVFGTKPQKASTGDGESTHAIPEILTKEPVVEAPAPPAVTKVDAVAAAELPVKKTAASVTVRMVKKKTAKTGTGTAKTAAKKKTGRPKKRSGSTCRDEMVAAVKALTKENGTDEFAAKEIVKYLLENGTKYSAGTIRSQLVSRSAKEAESSNGDSPKDFERVKRGVYRLAV